MQHISLWLHAMINYTHPSSSITSDRSYPLHHSLNSELNSYREQIMWATKFKFRTSHFQKHMFQSQRNF